MRTLAILALGLLAGCAATPNVTYHMLSEAPPGAAWVPYRLTDTRIAIGPVGKDAGKSGAPIDLAPQMLSCTAHGCGPCPTAACDAPPATMVQIGALGSAIDDRTMVLAIEPKARNFVSTNVTPSYVDGSLRLATLDIDTRDHRLEAIDTIGAIASGVMNIVAGRNMAAPDRAAAKERSVPLRFPIVIDLTDAKASIANGAALPANGAWSYQANFEDGDPARQGFLPRARHGLVHGAVLTATCRPMSVTLNEGDISLTLGLTVADPDWLTVIPFPATGTIAFHPLCGVEVKTGKDPTIGTDVLAQAFFKQVGALRAPTQ